VRCSDTAGGPCEVCQPLSRGAKTLTRRYAEVAKHKCETLCTDEAVFDVWADLVVAAERLGGFVAQAAANAPAKQPQAVDGQRLIGQGRDLTAYISRARLPTPKSTREIIERCALFDAGYRAKAHATPPA